MYISAGKPLQGISREAKWETEHPGKKFYERSEEDNRRDCTIDEWFWDFFERAHASESAEVRYQLERNPNHGFGVVPLGMLCNSTIFFYPFQRLS